MVEHSIITLGRQQAPAQACNAEHHHTSDGEYVDDNGASDAPKRVLRSHTRKYRAARTTVLMAQMDAVEVELGEDDAQWARAGMAMDTQVCLAQDVDLATEPEQAADANLCAEDEAGRRGVAMLGSAAAWAGEEEAGRGIDGSSVVFDDGG